MIKQTTLTALMIIFIITTLSAILHTQLGALNGYEQSCIKKYGENNYIFVDANRENMSFPMKYYIGQIWKCVPKSEDENSGKNTIQQRKIYNYAAERIYPTSQMGKRR